MDLTLVAGSLTVVDGPSGGGKSTLLATAMGRLEPLAGRVERHTAHFGYVPQQTHLGAGHPFSVEEVVLSGGVRGFDRVGRPSAEQRARATLLIAQLGLAGFARRAVNTLSGGQRQRVLVARALIAPCDVLVLDEPFSALDDTSAKLVLDLVDGIAAGGAAVLVATHHREFVGARATNAYHVARGAVAPVELMGAR